MIAAFPEIPVLQRDLIDNGTGYYPNKIQFDVLGYGISVDNTRLDVVNIGASEAAAIYVFPPAGGIQMSIVSTSVNDDGNPGGTGIRTVRIHYLDANYAIQTEDITLNGTTRVNTVSTNILRINEIHAQTIGSNGSAVGSISLDNTAGTVTYARIGIGFNRSRNGIFTVPAGKTGYLSHWDASSGTASGNHYTRFTLRMTTHDNVLIPGVFIAHDSIGTVNGMSSIYYDIPIVLPAMTDIKVSVISDSGTANAIVDSHFSGWYE